MERLDLHTVHEQAGARFVEDLDRELPACFSDPAEEQRFVREASGLIDRGYRGILDLAGDGVAGFLDGLFSSAVRSLTPGRWQWSCLLTPRGKLVAAFRLHALRDGSYRLVFNEPLRDSVVTAIEKYAFLDDVTVTRRSADTGILSLEGPAADRIITSLLSQGELPAEPSTFCRASLSSIPVGVARGGESPEGGLDLWAPRDAREELWRLLLQATEELGGGPVGHEAAETLRMEAGVPRYGKEYDEQSFPNEADLEDALTYDKCYVGQEVVSRMGSYGHANWRLRGLLIPGDVLPSAGANLRAGAEDAGRLTSCACSSRLRSVIALCSIHRKFWDQESLQVELTDGAVDARVMELPLARPGDRRQDLDPGHDPC